MYALIITKKKTCTFTCHLFISVVVAGVEFGSHNIQLSS